MRDRRKAGRSRIVAHRGATHHAPENTLAALEQAIALGADGVEFDVRRTQDGVLILHHDPELRGQAIGDLTFEQVQAIAPHIPTLSAALQTCAGRIGVDVELKEPGYEAAVVEALEQHYPNGDRVLTSFHPPVVSRLKQYAPHLPVGLLVEAAGDRPDDRATFHQTLSFQAVRSLGADFLAPHWSLVTPEFLAIAAQQQIPLWLWTVNDPAQIAQWLKDDRIAALITDILQQAIAIADATLPLSGELPEAPLQTSYPGFSG